MTNTVIIGGSKGLGRALADTAPEPARPVLSLSRNTKPSLDLTDRSKLADQYALIKPQIKEAKYVFFTAGIGYQGDLRHQHHQNITAIIDTAITGPLQLLAQLSNDRNQPIHLITITSTTSAKVRANETTYGAAKAGQAQLARNFHQELTRILPGSKSTLVHPGGMNTPFWDGTAVDTTTYLDPLDVARIIWDKIQGQTSDWLEFSITRQNGQARVDSGTPSIQFPEA